ncbi:MAG: glycosyltransferase family 39 protein, partial [Anaerolineae bacterium]|nr:glycosyltransferase family 39 protein [Anaerolineae bacterium]
MTLRRKATWIPVFAVLLAYLLRTSTLDFQSFWIDEIQAFYFIDHPLKETIKLLIAPDENGPLYFLLLWFWRRLGGPSDFAIRYLSDLCSVLTVAVMWRLARTWFNDRIADLTAVFLAISPFAIWHGQEAKMYGLHMFLAGLSTLLLIRAANRTARHSPDGPNVRLRTPRTTKTRDPLCSGRCQPRLRRGPAPAFVSSVQQRGAVGHRPQRIAGNFRSSTRTPRAWPLWLGYGIILNLLGYSHFFGAFTIAAQGFALVITHLKQRRVVRTYVLTMIIVALPYIPVVSFALRILPNFQMQDISKGFVPLRLMLHELASEYILRASRLYVEHMPRLLAYGAIAILLGTFRAWRQDWRKGLWVISLLVLPIAIFYPISFRVPVFSPKYLSATFLIFTLCLSLAVDQLARWWKPLAWV